jgi:hypothetical protein
MMRRILIGFSVSVISFTLLAHAADPPIPAKSDDRTPKSIQEEARLKQEILAGQFRDFELQMLQLANRLATSSKQEDREKSKVLLEAIKLANAEAVDVRFQKLVEMLKTSKAANLQDVKEAIDQAELLTQNLRAILSLLVNDTRDGQLKADKERIQNLLRELNQIIRDQGVVKVNIVRGMDPDRAAGDQDRVTRATGDLARKLGGKVTEPARGEARSEGRKGEDKGESRNNDGNNNGKPGDAKEGQGGEGKPGEGKGGEGKAGESKEGKNGAGQQELPPLPGRQPVEDALPFQKQAKNDIQNNEIPNAGDQQQKGLDELNKARRQLEEILKQLREEEIERLLAQLQARCEYMLQLQKEIYEGTVRLDKTIGENPGKKATRPDAQRSLQLADREGLVLQEAVRARELIISEGSAVAFAEVFTQLLDDIKLAQKNLNKTDVGVFTQKVERDIIDTLIEMIEAVKTAQQEMKQQQGQPQQGNPPPPGQQQKLIDLLAELKMIRSMQARVNKRTQDFSKLFPGERADAPDIQKELHNLADRQDKIKKIVHDIATGKNQ